MAKELPSVEVDLAAGRSASKVAITKLISEALHAACRPHTMAALARASARLPLNALGWGRCLATATAARWAIAEQAMDIFDG